MNTHRLTGLLLAFSLVSGPGVASEWGNSPATPDSATLTGKVVFAGKKVPQRPILDMSSKPEHKARCMQAPDKASRALLIDPASKGIANVFVEIRKVTKKKWKPDPKPIEADQEYCRFEPHIMVVAPGQEIDFRNSDPFLHNVNLMCRKNPASNFGIPEKGEKKISFKSSEKVGVRCDVHTWMKSWIVVTDNPYHALTGSDGSFTIKDVPPGEYEVRFWHETLGQLKKKKVKIGEGGAVLEIKSDDPTWKK